MKETSFEMKRKNTAKIIFVMLFTVFTLCLIISVIRTNSYNSLQHHAIFSVSDLFSLNNVREKDVSVTAVPRSSTWGKIYDPENTGITENNIQAYT